jgi:hypothetical protein
MRLLLPALLLVAAATARATEATWHLSLQLRSLHEHTSEIELHDDTPGIGLMRVTSNNALAGIGIFRNSLGRNAGYAYLGKQWSLGKIRVGGIAGVTHHYNFNNGGIVPLGAAMVTVPVSDRWSIDILGIPRVNGYTYTTVHFALRWRMR